jgi:nucleoside triphosphate pyrophosphatase
VKLIVASASPRRHELLAALGLAFVVRPAAIDEEAAARGHAPGDAVLAIAVAKAEAMPHADALVLTADTIVVLDGRVLGKPDSPADARRMLGLLRARRHRVLTAVCLATDDGRRTAVVESEVQMRAYGAEEIDAYLAAGGGLDKAGAYGIQDEPLRPVDAIAGCWCNVMGLPLWTAWGLLHAAGLRSPRTPDAVFARCGACPLARGAA